MERWNSSKLKQQIRRLDIQTVTRLIATDTGLEKSIGYFLRVFSLQNLVVYRVVWFLNLLAFSKSDGDPVYVSRYKYLVISWQFIFHGGLCWISFAINIIWQRHVVYGQFRSNQSSFIGKRWRSVPPSCSICCHILRWKYIRMEIVGIFSIRIQATIRKYNNTIRKCAPSKASKNIWDQNLQLTCSNSKRSQLPLLHCCKLSQQLNIFLYSVKCKFCAMHQILQYAILSDTFSGAFLPRQVSATVDVWIAFGHFPKQKITMDHTKFPIHTREVRISN